MHGHDDSVNCVLFSGDAASVVSAGNDSKIIVWDIRTGKAVRTLEGHTGGVGSLTLSPDGTLIASGAADNTVRIWDFQKGEQLRSLEGHTEPVVSLAFSPDGKKLASGSADKTARFWDVQSGAQDRSYGGHVSPVKAVAYAGGGKEVVTVSYGLNVVGGSLQGGIVRIQKLKLEEPKAQTADIDTGLLNCAALSPGGRHLLLGTAYPQGSVVLVDVQGGKVIRNLAIELQGDNPDGGSGTNWIGAVGFSSDGKLAAAGGKDKRDVYVWETETGKQLARFLGHTGAVLACGFSPDGRYVVSGGADKTVRIWRRP